MIPKNFLAARTLAVLAILSTPTFVWFGWAALAIPIVLGVLAVLMAPSPKGLPAEGRLGRLGHWLDRALHPHSWRPGKR